MTSGVKPWWKSKTIWAAVIAFLMSVAPELGIMSPDDAAGVGGDLTDIIAGLFAGFAIYGRVRARQRIGTPPPTDWES